MKTLGSIIFIRRTVLLASLAVIAWFPALPSQVHSEEANPSAFMGVVASGAVEDTLKACLDRIPLDASAGQRMMAELSCDRDEDTRKSMEAVPGR